MDQEVLKLLLGNISVAGVLGTWVYWLINDRKVQHNNFIEERKVLEKVITESLAEVKELNKRSRDDQKVHWNFFGSFSQSLPKQTQAPL